MRWAVLLGVALLASPAFGQAVYKWTDEQGRVHYGDRPTHSNASSVGTTAPPASDPAAVERRVQEQRLLEAFAEERREQKERAVKAEQDEKTRVANCARARDQVRGIQTAGQVYELDGQGNRRYLDDTRRSSALARARENVAHWCP
jgi:hypothetical protein